MNHVTKRILLSATAALCAASLLLPVGAEAAAAHTPDRLESRAAARAGGAQGASEPASVTLPDYANPSSEATVELSAAEFIEMLTGSPPLSVEATYVSSMLAGSTFRYHDAIPPRYVETTYDNNVLRVTARAYTYTTASGETVTWTPTTLTMEGLDQPIKLIHNPTIDAYMTNLTDVAESAGTMLEIGYTCRITVAGEVSDPLLNYTYRYADRLQKERIAYEDQLAAYEAYQAYLLEKAAYDEAKAAYDAYLAAKATYDKKHAAYLAYEKDMEAYREGVAAYNAYLTAQKDYEAKLTAYQTAYATYTTEQNAYLSKKEVYEAYRSELRAVEETLSTFESAFITSSDGKCMYSTLMGSTVDTVVNRKDELISTAGCDAKDIDTAASSTEYLRDHLTAYKELDAEGRLAFYKTNYAGLRDNFIALYGALRSLYNNDTVKLGLRQTGKLERYIEFLAQLYVLSTGLDDTTSRNPKWFIYGSYDDALGGLREHTVLTELEDIQRPADRNNATPAASLAYPTPVEEPVAPAPFTQEKPTAPAVVKKPTEPDPVQKPTEPTPVDPPPAAPAPLEDPGERPVAPTYTATGLGLLAALEDGSLTERPRKDVTLTFTSSVQKRLSLYNTRVVDFYDADGKTLLASYELAVNDPIPAPDITPTRETTAQYSYSFQGWKDETGALVNDLGVADEVHKVFYASYEATLRRYTVTWLVNDSKTETVHDFGTIPAFGETPTKETTAQYTYTFTGWRRNGGSDVSTDLVAVVADVTYEAVFEPILRSYTVSWQWHEGSRTEVLPYGAIPTPPTQIDRPEDDRHVYTFAGWDTSPAAVTGDATYTARYDVHPIVAPSAGEADLPLTVTEERYISAVPSDGLQVDRLLPLALQRDKEIELSAADGAVTLSLNEAMIADLDARGCAHIRLSPTDRAGEFTLLCTDAAGRSLRSTYPITLRYHGATAYTKAFTVGGGGLLFSLDATEQDGTMIVKLSPGDTVFFRNEYPITLTQPENALLAADRAVSKEGDIITLSLTFADDFYRTALQVVGTVTGTEYPVADDLTFSMPAEPVTVTASVARRPFTVTFLVDGEVVSTATYYKGDTVTLPPDPEKPAADGLIYTFSGWSPAVSAVTADVTYEAVFASMPEPTEDPYIPSESQNREYIIFIWIGAAVLVLGIIVATPILVTVRLVKRRKKRRAMTNASEKTE